MDLITQAFLIVGLLSAASMIASCDAETSGSILVVALSLASFSVNGHPVPLTTMILLDKLNYADRSLLTVSPSVEVGTLDLVVTERNLSVRSGLARTEQSNTTNTDSQPTQSMGSDDHSTASNGSISRKTIVTIVVCAVLFFTMLIILYLWRHYYPPRPGRRHNAYQFGVGPIQAGFSTSTRPSAVAAV